MSRTRHPNSYPIQFHEISTAALTKPQVFPIRIPFQTHAHAMTFRTRFYEFRRSLRAFAKTESSDPVTIAPPVPIHHLPRRLLENLPRAIP